MKLIKDFKNQIPKNNNNVIILVSVIRNEYLLLDYFLKYYDKLGVTHFIFIDNNSNDNTTEYLLNSNYNIMLFHTKDSYKENNYGMTWIKIILDKYCKNKWVVGVAADELIYVNKLSTLINTMEKERANVCKFYMLDMYPKDSNIKYKYGDSFLNHSYYYDKESEINKDYYDGMRYRTMNVIANLKKYSFFKYNFYTTTTFTPDYHEIRYKNNKYYNPLYITIATKTMFLLHFKFLRPNLRKYFLERAKRNEDWNNSFHYIAYSKAKNYNFYDPKYSLSIKKYKPKFSYI
jgi:hypothetical protein